MDVDRDSTDVMVDSILANIYADLHKNSLMAPVDFVTSRLGRKASTIALPIAYVCATYDIHSKLPTPEKVRDAFREMAIQKEKEEKGEHYSYKTLASKSLRASQRCRQIANHSLMMLAILAFASSFRKAYEKAGETTWNSLQAKIVANHESLEYFAKVRGSQWREVLGLLTANASNILEERNPEILGERLPGGRVEHPHTRVVPRLGGELRAPMCGTRYQINIEDYIFDSKKCNIRWAKCHRLYGKPDGWPEHMDYLSDPSLRMPDEKCDNCGSEIVAACIERSCDDLFTNPLVELFDTGTRGVGVRTLQAITAGDIIGEYLAEIVPTGPAYGLTWHSDRVYAWDMAISTKGKGDNYLYSLRAKRFGNWTRFVNHSCEESVRGTSRLFGGRRRLVYIARRNIAPFEELTVNYGNEYFGPALNRWCKCGEESCQFPEPLASEKEEGERPKKRKFRG
ncbi:hypothetical protein MMC13_004756 [Lambiella insularis]|nr:hypothetical protein [Lambiella insularis]